MLWIPTPVAQTSPWIGREGLKVRVLELGDVLLEPKLSQHRARRLPLRTLDEEVAVAVDADLILRIEPARDRGALEQDRLDRSGSKGIVDLGDQPVDEKVARRGKRVQCGELFATHAPNLSPRRAPATALAETAFKARS